MPGERSKARTRTYKGVIHVVDWVVYIRSWRGGILAVAQSIVGASDTAEIHGEIAGCTDNSPVVIARNEDLPCRDGTTCDLKGILRAGESNDGLLAQAGDYGSGCRDGQQCCRLHIGWQHLMELQFLATQDSVLCKAASGSAAAVSDEPQLLRLCRWGVAEREDEKHKDRSRKLGATQGSRKI